MGQPDPTLLGVFRGGAGSGNADIKDDGTFKVQNVFGPAQFKVTTPDDWAVKSITYGDAVNPTETIEFEL